MTTQVVQGAIKTGGLTEIAFEILASALVLGGLGCFGLRARCYGSIVFSHVPPSSAYPFVALGIFVSVLAGSIVFAESISVTKAVGVGLITGGGLLVGFGG